MMERAVLLSAGDPIDLEHLAIESAGAAPIRTPTLTGDAPAGLSAEQLEERARIVAAIEACRGNQTRAAKQLGISRRWLSTKMARYRIPRAREA